MLECYNPILIGEMGVNRDLASNEYKAKLTDQILEK